MRPFDGTSPFICLRIDNNGHLFDLPIDTNQLDIIVANSGNLIDSPPEPDPIDDNVPIQRPTPPGGDDRMVVNNPASFTMGQTFEEWSEDDDL